LIRFRAKNKERNKEIKIISNVLYKLIYTLTKEFYRIISDTNNLNLPINFISFTLIGFYKKHTNIYFNHYKYSFHNNKKNIIFGRNNASNKK